MNIIPYSNLHIYIYIYIYGSFDNWTNYLSLDIEKSPWSKMFSGLFNDGSKN